MMNKLTHLIRWIASAALVFAAAWAGFLAYMARSYAVRWGDQLDALQQSTSMVSIFVVNYWLLFVVFSLVLVVAAIYLAWKINAPIIFSLSVGLSSILAAFFFNVMVVSTGFELSSFLGK